MDWTITNDRFLILMEGPMAFDTRVYTEMQMSLNVARKYAEVQFFQAFRNLMEDHGGRVLKVASSDSYKPNQRVGVAVFDDEPDSHYVVGIYFPDEREGMLLADIDQDWPSDLTQFVERVRKNPANNV